MQIRWLRRALENLDDEAAYIATDNPRTAAEFVLHMRDSAVMLADHPNMGRPGRIAGTRELVVTRFSYILPYRVRGGAVEVLRVFHTARKWPRRMS
ncbi:MAG TPA: type II toxin-antitoxin system RelE/ParE family toxin [Burkholderiales bacterium]|nr:type II toxin-antitoxin system RelE/ParE family toxin [Burkholderiales bacterium]